MVCRAQIHNNAFLARIQQIVELRGATAGSIETRNTLHLDDARTGLHQQLPAQRSGPQCAEIDDQRRLTAQSRRCRGGKTLAVVPSPAVLRHLLGRHRQAQQPGTLHQAGSAARLSLIHISEPTRPS